MLKVNDITELIRHETEYLDGYVSTDAPEVVAYLEQLGFNDTDEEGPLRNSYDDLHLFGRLAKKGSLTIDCSDIPLEERERIGKEIGCAVMSKFRISKNGSPLSPAIYHPLIQVFNENCQNFSLVNDLQTKFYSTRRFS